MESTNLKKKYVGKYIILYRNESGLYECDKFYDIICKSSFDVGYTGFSFYLDKENLISTSKSNGIGLYEIVNLKTINDFTICYVKFLFRFTLRDSIYLQSSSLKNDALLFLFIYSSKNVIPMEDMSDCSDIIFNKNPEKIYNRGIISYYSQYGTTISEFNCDALIPLLCNKKPSESYPDCAIRYIKEGKLSVDEIIEFFSKPSKFKIYAKHVEEVFDLGLSEAEKEFPLLYHKLSKNYDIFSAFFINDIYDYLIRAHKKYLKYGFEDNAESMEEELNAVFDYEKSKKDKEKAERKAKRKAAKQK